jgi:hypothetical protein
MEQPLALLPPSGGLLEHSACPPRGGRFRYRAAKFVLAGDRMVNLKVT